jgi:hypothetical protein
LFFERRSIFNGVQLKFRIQGTSVPSERRFSASSALIGKRRTRLNIESVRASMCLHDWIKLDVKKENQDWLHDLADIAADEEIPAFDECEDAEYAETESDEGEAV